MSCLPFFRTSLQHGRRLLAPLILLAWSAQAQAPGEGGPGPNAQPTAVPIDGGASLLLAAGAAYGLRRLKRHLHS